MLKNILDWVKKTCFDTISKTAVTILTPIIIGVILFYWGKLKTFAATSIAWLASPVTVGIWVLMIGSFAVVCWVIYWVCKLIKWRRASAYKRFTKAEIDSMIWLWGYDDHGQPTLPLPIARTKDHPGECALRS